MSQNSAKKILIVSSYAPPAIGGPQNLYNLLRDFPTERYCILTSYYNIDNLSAQKGNWLAGKYVFYDNPKAYKDTRQNDADKRGVDSKISQVIQRLRFSMKRLAVMRFLGGLPVILSQIVAIVRAGKKTVIKDNIDILVGFSDYGPAMLGTYFLHKLTKKPYMIFLFDLYKGNFLPFPGGLFANIFEKKIFQNAQKIVVTNMGTKKFYQGYYPLEITEKMVVIHNSVFPDLYDQSATDEKPVQNKKRVLFTGRIYWPQIGALKNLIAAIEASEDNMLLEIYSPSPKDYLAKLGILSSNKIMIGMASPKEIPAIQKRADILFLPLSWNTESEKIIDTATPGKLTDYLISGKPMLIHAPASTTLVHYAREHKFAHIVDENNVIALQSGLNKLINDKAYRDELVANARKTFFENHDATKNAINFSKLFD